MNRKVVGLAKSYAAVSLSRILVTLDLVVPASVTPTSRFLLLSQLQRKKFAHNYQFSSLNSYEISI